MAWRRRVLALTAGGVAGLAAACAKQGAPPGGPEDRRPPFVVATHPDTFAVLNEPFRGPVRFDFNERVSERIAGGSLDQAVVVSPLTGRVRVSHGRQSLSVDLDGGFKPGLVYRVTLLPVLRDLFNNQMRSPFEIVFSTGGEFNASAVAGTVWDRTTAEGVDALQVLAYEEGGDSVPFVARTDSAGVYVFRYLPAAPYRVVAFQDRNRNGVADRMEMQGTGSFRVEGADTVIVDVSVLQPDTTPARLVKAEVLDSLTVMLEFDDFLDPESRSDLFQVDLATEAGEGTGRVAVFHEREYEAWRDQLQDSFAQIDSAEARQRAMDALEDAAARPGPPRPDTLSAPVAGPPRAPQPGQGKHPLPPPLPPSAQGGARGSARSAAPGGRAPEPLTPAGQPLPSRRLVLRPDSFLVGGVPYRATIGSVVNINGLGGGGGTATIVRQLPKDTASVQDSTAAADTVPPGTGGARRDTIRAGSGGSAWPFLGERRR